MNREPQVWIVNESGHDYSRAKSFGELGKLTLGDVNPLQLDRLNWHLARGVVKFTDSEDYLLISGTPVLNAMAVHLWLRHHGKCKILQWNAKNRDYELTEVNADHLLRILEDALKES